MQNDSVLVNSIAVLKPPQNKIPIPKLASRAKSGEVVRKFANMLRNKVVEPLHDSVLNQ